MIRWFVVVIALASCGGDKCAKVYDKLAPAMARETKGSPPDRDQMIGQCKKRSGEAGQEAMLDCILGISGEPTMEQLNQCSEKGGLDTRKHERKSTTEVRLNLTKIGKSAKVAYLTNAEFPKGKVGPTPAAECCGQPKAKCAVDAKAWTDPVWQALDFSVDEPSYYRYTYESDGKTFTAQAIGDLDCDTNTVTYTATGSIDQSGNPKIELADQPTGTE